MRILKYKSPNYWKGRNGHMIDMIVLHITDSSGFSALNTFLNPRSGVSAHYLIRKNSDVIGLVDEKNTAWHAGLVKNPTHPNIKRGVNPNFHSIGIEVVSKEEFPNIRQWFTWAKLVKKVARENSIPINDIGLCDHREIRSDKTCPGSWFNKKWAKTLTKIV